MGNEYAQQRKQDRRRGPIRSGMERRRADQPVPEGVTRSGVDRRRKDRRSGVDRRKAH